MLEEQEFFETRDEMEKTKMKLAFNDWLKGNPDCLYDNGIVHWPSWADRDKSRRVEREPRSPHVARSSLSLRESEEDNLEGYWEGVPSQQSSADHSVLASRRHVESVNSKARY
jgi:hypothetical protein